MAALTTCEVHTAAELGPLSCKQQQPLWQRRLLANHLILSCAMGAARCLQVASLDALRGQASVVPLLEYGVSSSISGTRQWVLVFPKYAGSMREWRLRWRGKGLDTQDLPVYLRLFIQVRRILRVWWGCHTRTLSGATHNTCLQQSREALTCTDIRAFSNALAEQITVRPWQLSMSCYKRLCAPPA